MSMPFDAVASDSARKYYRDQVNLVNEVYHEVCTVHSSQGQEWDVVLFSVCDTENMWFVDSHNKMSDGKKVINTAVSRAKKKLIIVCDAMFWKRKKTQLIKRLLDVARPVGEGETKN